MSVIQQQLIDSSNALALATAEFAVSRCSNSDVNTQDQAELALADAQAAHLKLVKEICVKLTSARLSTYRQRLGSK